MCGKPSKTYQTFSNGFARDPYVGVVLRAVRYSAIANISMGRRPGAFRSSGGNPPNLLRVPLG